MYTIVFELDGEPHKRRMQTFGLYPSHEAAFADLPRHVREWIDGEDEGDEPLQTPEELTVEVQRISMSGDGDAYGFRVYIAPVNVDEQTTTWALLWHWRDGTIGTTAPYLTKEHAFADGASHCEHIGKQTGLPVADEWQADVLSVGDSDEPFVQVEVVQCGRPSRR